MSSRGRGRGKAAAAPAATNPARPRNLHRYKTELCRAWQENRTCKYSDKCQFAHGVAELRAMARHPKYKTEKCRSYHTTGVCPYGPRCHFIHDINRESLDPEDRVALAASEALLDAEIAAENGKSARARPPAEALICLPVSSTTSSSASQPALPAAPQDPNAAPIPREGLQPQKITIPLEGFPLMQQLVQSAAKTSPQSVAAVAQLPVTVELNPELLAAASAQASVPLSQQPTALSGAPPPAGPAPIDGSNDLNAALPAAFGSSVLGGELHHPFPQQNQQRQPQVGADQYHAEIQALESQFQHIQMGPLASESRASEGSGGRTPPGFEQALAAQQQQRQHQLIMQQPSRSGFGQHDWQGADQYQAGQQQQQQPMQRQYEPMHQQIQQQYQPMHQQIQQQYSNPLGDWPPSLFGGGLGSGIVDQQPAPTMGGAGGGLDAGGHSSYPLHAAKAPSQEQMRMPPGMASREHLQQDMFGFGSARGSSEASSRLSSWQSNVGV